MSRETRGSAGSSKRRRPDEACHRGSRIHWIGTVAEALGARIPGAIIGFISFWDGTYRRVLGHPNLEIVHADFRHVDKIVQAMKGVDEVIHLGAIVGDPACALDEELTVEVNLMATRMIAEVAKGSGISDSALPVRVRCTARTIRCLTSGQSLTRSRCTRVANWHPRKS